MENLVRLAILHDDELGLLLLDDLHQASEHFLVVGLVPHRPVSVTAQQPVAGPVFDAKAPAFQPSRRSTLQRSSQASFESKVLTPVVF